MFLLAWCGDPGDLHCRENNDPRRALRGFLLPRRGTELYPIYNNYGGSNLVQLQSSTDTANLIYFSYIAMPR